jgi:hypothetical protein
VITHTTATATATAKAAKAKAATRATQQSSGRTHKHTPAMATVRLAETYEEDSLTAVISFVQGLLNEGQVRRLLRRAAMFSLGIHPSAPISCSVICA